MSQEMDSSWCLIDSQTGTVITTKESKEAIIKEQNRQVYGQTITEIGYGYEDEENDSEFVSTPEPAQRAIKPI